MFDVAIIGVGPAGATLARLIGGELSTLVVDRRPLLSDAPAEVGAKCCGGLLAPDAQKMLGRLGLGLPKDVLVDPQLFVVRAIDLPSGRERCYQRFYTNMDRERFDRWLISLVPPEVDVRPECICRSFERTAEGFAVHFTRRGERFTERARIIVGADGARSLTRRQAVPRHPVPRMYLAVQEWVESPRPVPYFSVFFDLSITDFYGWAIPKEDELLVAVALPHTRGARAKLEALKAAMAPHGYRLGRVIRRRAAFLCRPLRGGEIVLGAEGVGLVGEAAGWISPSSAEGLSYAFQSALAMSRALLREPGDFLRHYARLAGPLRRSIRLKALKSRLLYSPGLRRLVMRSGLCSLAVQKG